MYRAGLLIKTQELFSPSKNQGVASHIAYPAIMIVAKAQESQMASRIFPMVLFSGWQIPADATMRQRALKNVNFCG